MFGTPIDGLDTETVISRDDLFERLCRVICLTEQRGYRTVENLLRNPMVRKDPVLTRIFEIIRKDEPSHWAPYEGWLQNHGSRQQVWWERVVDGLIHSEMLVIKLPFVFFNPWIARRTEWPDAGEHAAPAGVVPVASLQPS